ncbi:hypothetical protein [Snodgrassella communis]|uniref:hypothetical protein n=1 Tax=Snodgrassella communis TaxID=2946699 RepID=UPI001C5574F0|nr:hypothetical protein [Snodgrassella communis]
MAELLADQFCGIRREGVGGGLQAGLAARDAGNSTGDGFYDSGLFPMLFIFIKQC